VRPTGRRSVALVTAREALALDEDLPPLRDALAARGAEVALPCWDDAAVDWTRFDIAVLRSTWDYAERIGEFLDWAARCAALTRLLNPLEVVRWNTDKRYLADLARAGVPVVPTCFIAAGADAAVELAAFLAGGVESLSVGRAAPFSDFVVKPVVGAGSRDAARYARAGVAQALAHLRRLLESGREAMLQPYLDQVDQHGETAVIFFEGRFSHAVRKGPLLRSGAGLVPSLFAPEQITPRAAEAAERQVAIAACHAIPFDVLLYARVDLVRGANGTPAVLELELTEPSIFFAHAPGAAERLAAAVLARCEA
jgi:glutathione synthase/RimK-type ligase-like ATP-grasp enzyme